MTASNPEIASHEDTLIRKEFILKYWGSYMIATCCACCQAIIFDFQKPVRVLITEEVEDGHNNMLARSSDVHRGSKTNEGTGAEIHNIRL